MPLRLEMLILAPERLVEILAFSGPPSVLFASVRWPKGVRSGGNKIQLKLSHLYMQYS